MRKRFAAAAVTLAAALSAVSAYAQVGSPFIHDPSTIVECDGKYYTFGTGGGGLISADGWTWESGAVRPGGGAAPDAMKIGDRYLVAYSATGGGLGGGHAGRILTMWNKTLDPNSPDFEYTEAVEVAHSVADEDWPSLVHLRHLLRLHPPGGAGPKDRIQGRRQPGHRRSHRLRSNHNDLPRRMVLPAWNPRQLL